MAQSSGSMWRWFLFISRPFGIALGIFIFLNLALALKEPRLSANRVWINVPLSEPWLSVFASLLGLALILPHEWGKSPRFRLLQGGIFTGFLALALANVIGYYHRLRGEEIRSHAAFPFSLLIVVVLLMEVSRVLCWGPVSVKVPRPARRFFGMLMVVGAWFIMILAHIYTFGMTDYTNAAGGADAAVVLGAGVYPDGTLSNALEYRMRTGVALYRERKARSLILSGGIDESGQSEPKAMARYAIENGVRPQDIILDEGGNNTYLSAKNCVVICRERGFRSLLVVSQYFHIARAKLIFERSGIPCYTVPAERTRPLRREKLYLFREAVAYPYYLVFHH